MCKGKDEPLATVLVHNQFKSSSNDFVDMLGGDVHDETINEGSFDVQRFASAKLR
jgi:hypothetical protein